MGKPRATRNRAVVLSSDDEAPPPARETRRTRSKGSPKSPPALPEDSLDSSPPKPPKPSRSKQARPSKESASTKSSARTRATAQSPKKNAEAVDSKPKEKSIYSFFNKATQPQSQPQSRPSAPPSAPADEFDDIVDDFESDGDIADQLGSQRNEKPKQDLPLRKRPNDGLLQSAGGSKYLKTDGGRVSPGNPSTSISNGVETKPWTERFAPLNFEELAVHKKKVSDVRSWLSGVLNGVDRKRLLVLKGPAGTGKTTTVDLISKELGCKIQEWRNPTGTTQGADGLVSMSAQFEDFIARSGTFGSLSIAPAGSTQPILSQKDSGDGRQIILIEEFPQTITTTSSATQMFRKSILQYLASQTPSTATLFSQNKPSPESITPVIMVISETLLSVNTSSADSFTAHRLLGQEILTHPGTTVIEFNPVAPTFLAKALELVIVKESRVSGRRKSPGPQVIKHLSEIGDVRSAISSLQFLCLRGDEQDGWGTRVSFAKQKKNKRDIPLTAMEKESLMSITQRESSLGIFHAVGKVVYNKRIEESADVPQPPSHLVDKKRAKASEVDTDSLIDELGTDISTFISALHENYVLSCVGLTDEDSLESLDGCIEALSDADLLSPDRFSSAGYARRGMQGTGSDALRQEEISFHAATRGILFHLPYPVKRIAPPGSGKLDAVRMFYPTSLRLWRRKEEIEGLVDLWVDRAQKGLLKVPSRGGIRKEQGKAQAQAPWAKNKSFGSQGPQPNNDVRDPPPLLAGGSSVRGEMLLERLPYLAAMLRSSVNPDAKRTVKDIQEITSFSGIGRQSDEAPEEEGLEKSPVLRRSVKEMKRKEIDKISHNDNVRGADVGEEGVAGLILSDDDIEDD